MKNIYLGSVIILVFLTQLSYAAVGRSPAPIVNPQVKICNQQLDAQAGAFFQQQVTERGDFITQNKSLIAKQDARGKWLMSHPASDPATPPGLSAQEASVFAAFVQKQQSEKVVFLNKLNQERQSCLSGGSITTTGPDATTTGPSTTP